MSHSFFSFPPLIKDFRSFFIMLLLCIFWYIFDRVAKIVVRRLFKAANENVSLYEDTVTRETLGKRLSTLRQLTGELIRIIIAFFFIFSILKVLGFNLGPVLAGVGVVGLAISFAAQNLIRDYINGIIILIENQFNIGDVIEIDGHTGTVEKFNLRATRIRGFSGKLIIIPNSLIQIVLNNTKNWSATIVKIGITYDSDYKKAMSIMDDLASTMYKEPESEILELPKSQGILEFTENGVHIRIYIKTVPGRQWAVSWAYRARLKTLFDAEGIKFESPRLSVTQAEE